MRWITQAAIVFALALSIRMAGSGNARVRPFDDAYHLKRIAWSVENFPRVLEFDPDRGVDGAFCPWPPLYDLSCAAIALVAGLDNVVRYLPPVVFSLLCALVTMWIARAFSAAAGLTAGLGLVLAPYLISISRAAAIDHHFVEPAFVLAILASTQRGRGVWLGMAIASAMLVQPALIIAAGLAFVVVDKRDGAMAFSIAAIAIALYRVTRPDLYPDSAWFLGWPHVGLLVGAAVACVASGPHPRLRRSPLPEGEGDQKSERQAALTSLSRNAGEGGAKRRVRAEILATILGIATALVFPGTIEALLGALRFVGRDPWLDRIVEFQPMFLDPQRWGTDIANLGGGAVLAFFLFRRHRAVALFAVGYLVLALLSRRFLVPAIPLFVLAGAVAVADARTHLRRALMMAAMLLPPLAYDIATIRQPDPSHESFFQIAAEVRALPPGRVLAPWSYGHAIDVFGRHPVILDNFGPAASPSTFVEGSRALVTHDSGRLREYCLSRGVRFVALPDPINQIPGTAASIGVEIRRPRETVWWRLQNGETIGGFIRRSRNVFEVR